MSVNPLVWVCLIFCAPFLLHALWRWQRSRGRVSRISQVDAVSGVRFSKRPLMNKSEFWLYSIITPLLPQGYRVFSQVCCGSFLSAADPNAFAWVNSKRVDFLIVDPRGFPAAVIEYQGPGHHQSNSAERDAVKRIAMKSASVPFVEVTPADGEFDIAGMIWSALGLEWHSSEDHIS